MATILEVQRMRGESADIAPGPTEGRSAPIGATPCPAGVNFSVFSRDATGVELLLFDGVEDAQPARVIRVDPARRSYHYWHVFVPGVKAGQI
jgi:glycogen operon protein